LPCITHWDDSRNQNLPIDSAEQAESNAGWSGRLQRPTGAPKSGPSLLAGLMRCGVCGRPLHIKYILTSRSRVPRYECRGDRTQSEVERCLGFGGARVDQAVVAEVLEAIRPLGIQAALDAWDHSQHAEDEKQRALKLALEKARCEAGRIELLAVIRKRRFLSVGRGPALRPLFFPPARGRRCVAGFGGAWTASDGHTESHRIPLGGKRKSSTSEGATEVVVGIAVLAREERTTHPDNVLHCGRGNAPRQQMPGEPRDRRCSSLAAGTAA
jgi:Recombinase zinc beta ribbon domain